MEDFERILNADWPERMQEILSLGRERRPIAISPNMSGSLRRDVSYSPLSLLAYACFGSHYEIHIVVFSPRKRL